VDFWIASLLTMTQPGGIVTSSLELRSSSTPSELRRTLDRFCARSVFATSQLKAGPLTFGKAGALLLTRARDFRIASSPYSSTIFYRKECKVSSKGRKVPQGRVSKPAFIPANIYNHPAGIFLRLTALFSDKYVFSHSFISCKNTFFRIYLKTAAVKIGFGFQFRQDRQKANLSGDTVHRIRRFLCFVKSEYGFNYVGRDVASVTYAG
jgi:hypothetical protein